jgi:MFS family permease
MTTQTQKKTRTIWIIIGTMLGVLLASLDSNIISTAMPKIIGSLNGTALYTWPVTVYMLCMTISIPLVGKLSDI